MSSEPGAISSTATTRAVIDLLSDLDWKTAKVCDVGAGRGHFSHSFGEKLRTEHGLDPAEHIYPCDLIPDTFEYDAVECQPTLADGRLPFDDNTFDAVWANGVLHHTGDTERAIEEIRRVLKPGGRAILSHFYRRPSWFYWVSRLGRQNVEFDDEDPPVTDYMREEQILSMFRGFTVENAAPEHYRALRTTRRGLKARLYNRAFKPTYNLLPMPIARRLAHKFSVTAIKR